MEIKMQLEKLEPYLSKERLECYGIGQDLTQKIQNYKWNIRLSESLYPILNVLEVSFRNRLHHEIGDQIGDRAWLMHQNPAILHESKVDQHWIQNVTHWCREFKKKKKLTEGKLIAEMNLGFWTMLLKGKNDCFAREHPRLYPALKNKVFPNAHGYTVKDIRIIFNQARKLRNRIYHYEPIFHWKDLKEQHDHLLRAINWIDPDLLMLVDGDRFNSVYEKRRD